MNKQEEKEIWVCAKETGDKIEKVDTIEQGKKIIKAYEKSDKKDGIFEPDFYSICDIDGNEIF